MNIMQRYVKKRLSGKNLNAYIVIRLAFLSLLRYV